MKPWEGPDSVFKWSYVLQHFAKLKKNLIAGFLSQLKLPFLATVLLSLKLALVLRRAGHFGKRAEERNLSWVDT